MPVLLFCVSVGKFFSVSLGSKLSTQYSSFDFLFCVCILCFFLSVMFWLFGRCQLTCLLVLVCMVFSCFSFSFSQGVLYSIKFSILNVILVGLLVKKVIFVGVLSA